MSKQKLGVLGTLSSVGSPQSAIVGIAVTSELEIIFDTVKSSRKFQNLISNSGCSFVVGVDRRNHGAVRGSSRSAQGSSIGTLSTSLFRAMARMPQSPELARHHVFRGPAEVVGVRVTFDFNQTFGRT
jgi:hypothetical protein